MWGFFVLWRARDGQFVLPVLCYFVSRSFAIIAPSIKKIGNALCFLNEQCMYHRGRTSTEVVVNYSFCIRRSFAMIASSIKRMAKHPAFLTSSECDVETALWWRLLASSCFCIRRSSAMIPSRIEKIGEAPSFLSQEYMYRWGRALTKVVDECMFFTCHNRFLNRKHWWSSVQSSTVV